MQETSWTWCSWTSVTKLTCELKTIDLNQVNCGFPFMWLKPKHGKFVAAIKKLGRGAVSEVMNLLQSGMDGWVWMWECEDINVFTSEIRILWCHFLFVLKEHRIKSCYWNLQIIGGFLNSKRTEHQSKLKTVFFFLSLCCSMILYTQQNPINLRQQRTKYDMLDFFRQMPHA